MDQFFREVKDEQVGKIQTFVPEAPSPDAAARALKLDPRINPSQAPQALPAVEAQDRARRLENLVNGNAHLRDYLTKSPAALAQADVTDLESLSGLDWAFRAASEAYEAGSRSVDENRLIYRRAIGVATPEEIEQAEALLKGPPRRDDFGQGEGWFAGGLVAISKDVAPQLVETLGQIGVRGTQGAAVGASVGSVAPGVGTTAGAVAGFTAGATVAAAEVGYEQAVAEAYREYRNLTDEAGNPIDPDAASVAAAITGVPIALLDLLGLGAVAKQIPGAKQAIGKVLQAGVREALTSPTIRGILARRAAGMAGAAVTEVATEGLQELIQAYGSEIAGAEGPTVEEASQRSLDAMVQAAQVMSILGPVIGGTGATYDVVRLRQAEKRREHLRKLSEDTADHPLRERAPAVMAEVIDSQSDETHVYIDGETLDRLYQGQPPEPPNNPNWREKIQASKDTGIPVELTLGEFIASPLSQNPEVHDVTVADPEDPTVIELDELFGKEVDVYHGSLEVIDEFDPDKTILNRGVFFSPNPQLASEFSLGVQQGFDSEVNVHDNEFSEIDAWLRTNFGAKVAEEYAGIYNAWREAAVEEERMRQEDPDAWIEWRKENYLPQYRAAADFLTKASNIITGSPNVTRARINLGKNLEYTFKGTFDWDEEQAVIDQARTEGYDSVTFRVEQEHSATKREEIFYSVLRKENIRRPRGYDGPSTKTGQGDTQPAPAEPEGPTQGPELPMVELPPAPSWSNASSFFRQKLMEIGVEETFADYYGQILAGIGNLAERAGLDPVGFIEQYAPEFRLTEGPEGTNERGLFIGNLDTGVQIQLFEKADLSTVLHETGHLFLEVLRSLRETAPDLAADWAVLKERYGLPDDGRTPTEAHEKFAQAFEAYMLEGNAPAVRLIPAFEAFRNWLGQIYSSVRQLGGKVDDELGDIFDRMLAADNEIAAAGAYAEFSPTFASAEMAGMTPEEYAEYLQKAEDARQKARQNVLRNFVGDKARLSKGWLKQVMSALRGEIKEKLLQDGPYAQRKQLSETKLKMDKAAFIARWGEEAYNGMPKSAFGAAGVDPEIVAEFIGYGNADAMVAEQAYLAPIDQAAKELALQRMEQDYGDKSVKGLRQKVEAAMTSEEVGQMLETELNAMRKLAGLPQVPPGYGMVLARRAINDITVAQLQRDKPSRETNKKLARAAKTLFDSGDVIGAAEAKLKQFKVFHQRIARRQALNQIAGLRRKAMRYSKAPPQNIDPAYIEQILGIIGRYEFAKVGQTTLARREALWEFMQRESADGQVFTVPPKLLEDAEVVNYTRLTVGEVQGIADAITNLEHLGRNKHRAKIEGINVEFGTMAQEIVEGMSHLPPRKIDPADNSTRLGRTIRGIGTALLRMENLLKYMSDGDITRGAFRYLWLPFVDAESRRNDMLKEFTAKMAAVFEGYPRDRFEQRIYLRTRDETFTFEQIFMIGAHMGTELNRNRITSQNGWGFNADQLTEALGHLTRDDWERIQAVWNVMNDLVPEIDKLQRRLTGVPFVPEKAFPFVNQHGRWTGGYIPITYENFIDIQGDNLYATDNLTPFTQTGYLKERTSDAQGKLRLEIGAITRHIGVVIHDLTHREAVRSTYKLLTVPEVKEAIESRLSREHWLQLVDFVKDLAHERYNDIGTAGPRALLRGLRRNATTVALGFRVATAFVQPVGILQARKEVKGKYLVAAAIDAVQRPRELWEFITAQSGQMRHRATLFERDIGRQVEARIRREGLKLRLERAAFSGIMIGDRIASTVVWWGRYNQWLNEHPGDTAGAIRAGDNAVSATQGSGGLKDVSAFQRNEDLRILAMFYSFSNAMLNMQIDLARQAKRAIRAGDIPNLAETAIQALFVMFIAPTVVFAVKEGLKFSDDDDDDLARRYATQMLGDNLTGIPLVREAFAFESDPTPLTDTVRTAKALISELGNVLDDDEVNTPRLIQNALNGIGYTVGLPTGQFSQWTRDILEAMQGESR